jgi:hypothetical protein
MRYFSIFVMDANGRSKELQVEGSHDIESVKAQIQDMWSYMVSDQRLIYKGRQLDNMRTLDHYGIGVDDTVHLRIVPARRR